MTAPAYIRRTEGGCRSSGRARRAVEAATIALAGALTVAGPSSGQAASAVRSDTTRPTPGRVWDRDLWRAAELAGATGLSSWLIVSPDQAAHRRCSGSVPEVYEATGADCRLELLPPTLNSAFLSGYPRDRDNGVLWAGRGLSTAASAGVSGAWGPFSAALHPVVAYQENRAFETLTRPRPGFSPYSHPWRPLDWPQRMGVDPFWTIHPGQSYVRADAFGVAAGASTSNMWWGPGVRNSIMLSDAAPGFPHLFVGTSRPTSVWIGRVEGRVVWGWLSESDHFDDDPGNDRTFLTGFVGAFEPGWIPGLYLGAARVLHMNIPEEGLGAGAYLSPFGLEVFADALIEDAGTWRDETNQQIALYARWALPESGFETYAEWARNDRSQNLDDFIQEPDHSQAYILGFQKVFAGDRRWVRLQGELTHLERSITSTDRGLGPYYYHSEVIQGYTHRGQLLGAWIGPGSSSQFLGLDLFRPWGRIGGYLERVRFNTDAYYRYQPRWGALGPGGPINPPENRLCKCGDWVHDVELTAGVRGVAFWRGVEVAPELAYSYRLHRNFYKEDRNWTLGLDLRWVPGFSYEPLFRPRSATTRPPES